MCALFGILLVIGTTNEEVEASALDSLPVLELNTPSSGQLVNNGDFRLYRMQLQAGDLLVINLNSSSLRDANELYVRYNALASVSDFDFAARVPNQPDQWIETAVTRTGTYCVMVRLARNIDSSSSFVLRAFTLSSLPRLEFGVATNTILNNAGDFSFYRLEVSTAQRVILQLKGTSSSDINQLYVRLGALPSTNTFDFAARGSQAGQVLEIPKAQPGNYYIMVRAQRDSDNADVYSLRADSEATLPVLSLGRVVSDTLAEAQSFDLYRMDASAGQRLVLQVRGDGVNDINDLHVSYGAVPTLSSSDFRATTASYRQWLEIPQAQSGTYFVLVYARTDRSSADGYRLFPSIPPSDLGTPGELNMQILSPTNNQVVSKQTVDVSGTLGFEANSAIDLILVLDTSGSLATNDREDNRRQAVLKLLGAIPASADVRVGIVDFDSDAVLIQALTNNIGAAALTLMRLDQNGGTRIDLGIDAALKEFQNRGRPTATKIVVLFSDGESGGDPYGKAIAANLQGVIIHSVFLGSKATAGASAMEEIAITTFGTYRQASTGDDLLNAFSMISAASLVDRIEVSSDAAPDKIVRAAITAYFWEALAISVNTNSNAATTISATAFPTNTLLRPITSSVRVIYRAPMTNSNVLPVVTLTSPLNGMSFVAPARLRLEAQAGDPDGEIAKVEFFEGATKLGESLQAPYGTIWSNVPAGNYVLTAKATDNSGALGASAPVVISVLPALTNQVPVLSPVTLQRISEMEPFSLRMAATDPDVPAQALKYGLESGAPAGANLDSSTGQFTWTPTEAQGPSTNVITVRVTDNGSPPWSATNNFTIIVQEVNRPPALSPIADRTLKAGESLNSRALATDADLPTNMLTFSLEGQAPTSAGIDPRTGHITWTPTAEQAPSTNRITVRVTDNGVPPLSDSKSFRVVVQPSPATLSVVISSPAHRSTFCIGTDVPVLAITGGNLAVSRVEFYAGTELLGTTEKSPYQMILSNKRGYFVLRARAVGIDGTSVESAPVEIGITDICGEVAIIRDWSGSSEHPEVERMRQALFDMGLSSVVFNQAELSVTNLAKFRLVIWNDLGERSLSSETVRVLQELRLSKSELHRDGMPLYLIGEHLSSVNLANPSSWTKLTHLKSTGGRVTGRQLEFLDNNQRPNLFHGFFGNVAPFVHGKEVERTEALEEAEVMALMDGSAMLVQYPRSDLPNEGEPRSLTQNFLLAGGDTGAEERKRLFKNAVCWLARLCPDCTAANCSINLEQVQGSVDVGMVSTNKLRIQNNGECLAEGAWLTVRVPEGLDWDGVDHSQGLSSHYDGVTRTAKLEFGRLGGGDLNAIEVSVRLKAARSGTWTVKLEADANNVVFPAQEELVIEVKPGLKPVLRVERFRQGNPSTLRLHVTGQANQRYQIQSTDSLVPPVQWSDGPSFNGPEWFQDFDAGALGARNLFYRCVTR